MIPLILLIGLVPYLGCESLAQGFVFPPDDDSPIAYEARVSDSSLSCSPNMDVLEANGERFCECRLGYIYFAPQNACFLPYRRGPCSGNEYLIVPRGQEEARCERNPCRKDGRVRFEGRCHHLDSPGSHCPGNTTLSVNETTLDVECTKIRIEVHSIINGVRRDCGPGRRMTRLGRCRNTLK